MTMTDPIADFLTRLRNANSAYHDEVTLPHSKIKANIAEILKAEGYISDYHTEDARVGKSLVVQLKYGPSRERSIAGLRRVSKPGRRRYVVIPVNCPPVTLSTCPWTKFDHGEQRKKTPPAASAAVPGRPSGMT